MTSRRARAAATLAVAVAVAAASDAPASSAFNRAGVEGNVFTPHRPTLKASALASPTTAATTVSIPARFGGIDINSAADAAGIRQQLIDYIWKGAGFPSGAMPSSVQTGVSDSDFSGSGSIASIDRLNVKEEYGVTTYEYLFHARNPLNRLVIYHEGHNGTFRVGKSTIQYFTDRGYDVLALSMPLVVDNPSSFDYWRPYTHDFGKVSLYSHYYVRLVETASFSGIKYFMEPVAEGLNYALSKRPYGQVAMVGFGGGGWTTTLYAAVDPRVQRNYAIAGSLPFFLRWSYNPGDWEQMVPGLYHVADYLELYILDAANGSGRHSMQILNSADPCCFSGATYRSAPYDSTLDSVMSAAGIDGSFDVYIDDNAQNSISPNALDVIASDLAQ